MMKIYGNAEQLIGRTPLVRAGNYMRKFGAEADIVLKLETQNPTGSAKDRAAAEMLDEAERTGKISRGATIIEPTSGNTGIGLAAIAAIRGYRAVIVMPDTMSPERIKLMRAYGARVELTPGKLGMSGAVLRAEQLAAQISGSFIPDQFSNAANPAAHYKTTGPEIWEDTDGTVDILVAGVGTGGTLTGAGKFLKERSPSVRVVAVEPASSPLLSKGYAGNHKIQGIGADFVPATLDLSVTDEIVAVSDDDARTAARELAQCEGILCGISSGAVLSAALTLAKRPENKGKRIVAIMHDSGKNYLSGDLYE